jgi:hypothetical protein
MSDFRVDIGRADRGRTFVRVIHVPTGKQKIAVGLDGLEPNAVAQRLERELREELASSITHLKKLNKESGC